MAMTRVEIQAKYDAKHRKSYSFKLHLENDADIIAKLAEVPSMQCYIKELIRQDIAKNGTGSTVPVQQENSAAE